MATRRVSTGKGRGYKNARGQGACGGTPRRDGSGGGTGNRNTSRQPAKKK